MRIAMRRHGDSGDRVVIMIGHPPASWWRHGDSGDNEDRPVAIVALSPLPKSTVHIGDHKTLVISSI